MFFKRNCCNLVVTFYFKVAFMQFCNKRHFHQKLLKLKFLLMNHLLLAFWFLQDLRMKKNDIESEEEKKIDNVRWKANRIFTMAIINLQMVPMGTSMFSSHILLPAEIWSNWRSSEKISKFWWHFIKMGENCKVFFQITSWVKTLKKHIENQYWKGKIKCLGN